MDTTADAYLYAGVRMMGEFYRVLDNAFLAAILQLVGAGLGAWLVSEKWQRWRQRREFQHHLMVRFADLSGGLLNVISHLLMNVAGSNAVDRYQQRLDLSTLAGNMASMTSELGLIFDDKQIPQLAMLQQRVITGLLAMAVSTPPATREQFDPVQQFAIDVRQLAMIRIAKEMGLLKPADPRVATAEARGSEMPTAVRTTLLAYLPASYLADLARAAGRNVRP